MQEHETVVVVAGGDPGPPGDVTLPRDALVIAADGGVDRAHALGLPVAHAVGDFDSATDAALARAVEGGARVDRHPAAKDATDLELALTAALEHHPRRVVVVGSAGGRLDHLLASLLLLAAPEWEGVEIDALLGSARVHVVRDRRTIAGTPGELLTLVAVNGPAEGVSTDGLRYTLRGETLHPGSSRGVSNVFEAGEAVVELERGVLLAVCPGGESS